MKVTGYWEPERCDIEPTSDDEYIVFIRPLTRDSNRLARTECVGFATCEEIAKYILW